MKTLHLNLKRKWFDMVLSGEKKEEYRDITGYWLKRLCINLEKLHLSSHTHFDTITFSNGYAKNRDQFVIELQGITIGIGVSKWGGGETGFILKLGKIVNNN